MWHSVFCVLALKPEELDGIEWWSLWVLLFIRSLSTVVSFAVEQKLMTMNNLIIAQARMCNIVEAEHIPATRNLFYSHFGVLHARHIKSMLKIE